MFIKADTNLEQPKFRFTHWCGCVLHASSLLTPHSCFPVSLYVCLCLSLTHSFSQRALISAGQEMKLHCPATPSRRGGPGEGKRKRFHRVKEVQYYFLLKKGMKRLIVWGCEWGLGWAWLSTEKAERFRNDIETRKYFHNGAWLTAGLNELVVSIKKLKHLTH